ncbi:MAG: hypothetical protein WBQ14_06245 [Gaiellaceae bacterium]
MALAKETLWLSVSEPLGSDNGSPVASDIRGWHVSLTFAPTLLGASPGEPFRTSPVFPVASTFAIPDFSSQTIYLAFLCFDPAFPILARLEANTSPDVLRGLLFSLGLASIVVCSPDPEILTVIENTAGQAPRASEVWTVEHAAITNIAYMCPTPIESGDPLAEFPNYDALPVTARAAVDEFTSSILLLNQKVATYVPSELPIFVAIIARARELVDEMLYASCPKGAPPKTLCEYSIDEVRGVRGLADTIFNQALDRLIQINSALSYFATQALSGAIPLLERRSLIRRNSLLGVGTATLALTRLTSSIEYAFAQGALEDVIGDLAKTGRPLPGLERLPDYNTRDWREFGLDQWHDRVRSREQYCKLPYFSGRLGFRETEYTISAAPQSLTGGAHPEWAVLTLTHEMVHGHVRNLLSLLFQGEPNEAPGPKWQAFYERFAAHVKDDVETPGDFSLLDSLRSLVLIYCCLVQTHGSLTRPRSKRPKEETQTKLAFDCFLPDQASTLWTLFSSEYRNISEIFVLVLDLHYFYGSSLRTYLQLIWRSWAPLSQVRTDLPQYVLRSILAASTRSQGTSYSRFLEDRARVVEILEELVNEEFRGVETIREALSILKAENESMKLLYPYSASLIIADTANNILTSSAIRAAVTGSDKHVTHGGAPDELEQQMKYDMPPGFVDAYVMAPAILLADRVGGRVTDADSQTVERETVELFLACASRVEVEEGENEPSKAQ